MVATGANLGRDDRVIRVLVVDDHPMVRAVVVDLLEATDGISVVGEAGDGREAIEFAERTKPDVVLMDVSMPNMSGIEATEQMIAGQSDARVLMFSAEARTHVMSAAREAGAVGFVKKGGRAADVIGAIRAVSNGRSIWPAGGSWSPPSFQRRI